MTWQTVYESFLHNPRDVKTTPKTNQTPLWFYVYAEDDDLYIENAKIIATRLKLRKGVS